MPIQLRRQLRHKYKSTKYTESKSEQQVFKIAQHTVMLMLKKWKVKKNNKLQKHYPHKSTAMQKGSKSYLWLILFLLFFCFYTFLVVGSVR